MPFYTMPDHQQLHVRRFGQGQPVLVLSGLGMQSWQWLPFLYAYRKQFEFIIPDWRGFGPSIHCEVPHDTDAIASHWQDIQCLIEQLQLEQFHLIGYSMGATTSMHGFLFGDLATKIKAYLHIDQTPHIAVSPEWPFGLMGTQYGTLTAIFQRILELLKDVPNQAKVKDLTPSTQQQLMAAWCDFLLLQEKNQLVQTLTRSVAKLPKLKDKMTPMQHVGYIRWYIQNYAEHRHDYRPALYELNCPLTYFIGRQSSLYASEGQLLVAKQTPHAKTVIFEHSGHAPLIREPFKFKREIGIFLQQFKSRSMLKKH